MKRNLKVLYNGILVISVASFLSACGKQDEARQQFKAAAQKQLLSIANKLSTGKGVARRARGVMDNSWVPYNNVYQQSSVESELQDCKEFERSIQPTKQNFKALVSVLYQCSMQVLQYRNGFNTALYRNLGDPGQPISVPQQANQYGWSWRYPYQYPNYAQGYNQNQYQYQNTYGQNGYIPTTVNYGGNPYGY